MKHIKNICRRNLRIILVFVLAAGMPVVNFAQSSTKLSNTPVWRDRLINMYSVRDAEFLARAAEINLEGISLSQLAQRKGMMEQTKDLGKMLEYVHAMSLKDLDALAKTKMITIPNQETYNIQNTLLNLNAKSSAEFDKAYCDAMVMSHRHAIMIFEKASKESDDLDIRRWATETLYTLHTYFEHSLSCLEKCDKARG